MRDKNLLITIAITFLLFFFVIFLIYLIYCYVYYDQHQENYYVRQFNEAKYSFIYKNLNDNELPIKEYLTPINIMYDKNSLTDIYNKYYKSSSYTINEFISKYYFSSMSVTKEQMKFTSTGKTNLIKRRNLKIEKIEVENSSGLKSTIGLIKNISLKIDDNSTLKVDDKDIECHNNICTIDKIYGGLHEIIYKNNTITYYGLLNINQENAIIDISLLDSLIKIS